MSERLTCPHCRRAWTPKSRRESASNVCLECRATPALGARVPAAAPSPGSTQPLSGQAQARPIMAVAAAGAMILLFLGVTGIGAIYAIRHATRPAEPAAVEAAMPPPVQAEPVDQVVIREPELAKVAEPIQLEPLDQAACELEPAPAPRLEAMPEAKPERKSTPADIVDAKPAPQTAEPPMAPFKRMRPAPTADELVRQLFQAKEIELEKPFRYGVARDLLVFAAQHRDEMPRPTPPIYARIDLAGLPMRMGMDCHLGKESAEAMQILSRKLRSYMSESVSAEARANRSGVEDSRPSADFVRGKLLADGEKTWTASEAVPTLVQILQGEDRPMRLLMVELLARIKCREATQALAQRATFDVAADVREAAVNALRDRPSDDVREALIGGLRYPWPAAAEFAAEAFANLADKSAVPYLARLLDEPDPAAPYRLSKGANAGYFVREVVRVNHLRNCMMCHSPSLGQSDLVRAPVPSQSQPLPPAFSPAYYQAPPSPGNMFVRADVTYLKQDFSTPQAVANPGPWPAHQRYDYFVRLKQVLPVETPAKSRIQASYPQKQAVLFALRELTGEDHGDTTADWQAYLQKMHGN